MVGTNYSHSKCPKCDKTFFEVIEETPTNSNWKMFFIRCSSCKVVVGTSEFLNLGNQILKIQEKLGIIV